MAAKKASAPTLYDFPVRNRWTNETQFVAKIEADPSVPIGVRMGLAVKWGFANGSYLARAYLAGADLAGADLAGAYLAGADLAGADLAGALIKGEKIIRLIAIVNRLIDPYPFLAFELEAGGFKIMAGCRWFTSAEFAAHVAKEYPDTDKARETLAILDFIDDRAKALGVKEAI